MADPPSIRRLLVQPPTIPAHGPAGPLAGQTELAAAAAQSDELGEDTSSLVHGVQLVAQLLEGIASEVAALAAADGRPEYNDPRIADLQLRAAPASSDALDQREEAARLLELAAAHPLTPRLRVTAAINDAARLEGVAGDATGALAIEVADAWLWRHGKLDRAGELADRLLAGELPAAWRAHVHELALLAHTAAGHWPRVIELSIGALTAASPPDAGA